MAAKSLVDIHNIRLSIDRIGNISDNIVRLGPVKFGLDGFLELIPVAGEIYSLAAGAMMVIEGARARLPFTTLLSAVALIGARTALGSPDMLFGPLLGAPTNLIASAFRAHHMVAEMMIKGIDETYYVEMSRAEAMANPDYDALIGRITSGQEKRRIVFLG